MLPILRESIAQYVDLIQVLTNQNISSTMNEQISKHVLEQKSSLDAFFAVRNAEYFIYEQIVDRINIRVTGIAEGLGLEPEIDLTGPSTKDCGFYFRRKNWIAAGICVGFAFVQNNFGECFFGVAEEPKGRLSSDQKERLKQTSIDHGITSLKEDQSWIVWRYWDDHRTWGQETFTDALFGEHFFEQFCEKLESLAGIADEFVKSKYS